MKESYESGSATHIGPESCGAAREGGVEALTRERAGRVCSRVRQLLRDADAVRRCGQDDGTTRRKANCDVEMAFYLMKEKENCDRVIVLSGDGDFLPVLKYLRRNGKEV